MLQRLLQYLSNAQMTLDLEANEVEVKVLTSLASVAESTGCGLVFLNRGDEGDLRHVARRPRFGCQPSRASRASSTGRRQ